MGELILCSRPLAKLPYELESASLSVYSLEELSYYVLNNLYLLDETFMSAGLCDWLDKELDLKETAEKLRNICQKNGTLPEFLLCILSESGYCSSQELRQAAEQMQKMAQIPDNQRGKIKGDRYMQKQRYADSIREYRKLLAAPEEKSPDFLGKVWHNLGCAYARLFLFQEAADCYLRAYAFSKETESLAEALAAYRCNGDRAGMENLAEKCSIETEKIKEMEDKIQRAVSDEEVQAVIQKLNGLFVSGNASEIMEVLTEWKNTYRKNCRM